MEINLTLFSGVRGHTGRKISCPESTRSVYFLPRDPTDEGLRNRTLRLVCKVHEGGMFQEESSTSSVQQ